jgi:hypothetical protein
VGDKSVYALLHRERDQLFPDEMFEDLFAKRGRCSIPPCVVAVVMVLQKTEGLSDREAVERASRSICAGSTPRGWRASRRASSTRSW